MLALHKHKTAAIRNVATTVLERLYEFASEDDRCDFEPQRAKSAIRESSGPEISMAKVSNINAKTFSIAIEEEELQQDLFLDKKIVRAKGIISVQIDRETCLMTLCTTNKTAEDIVDLLDAYDIAVDLKDIEEIREQDKENDCGGEYVTKQNMYNDPAIRRQRMLSRTNHGDSVQAKLDAKMRKPKAAEQSRGWFGSLLGW